MHLLIESPGCTLLAWYMYEPPSLSARLIVPALNWLPALPVVALIAALVPTTPTITSMATAIRLPSSLREEIPPAVRVAFRRVAGLTTIPTPLPSFRVRNAWRRRAGRRPDRSSGRSSAARGEC